MAPYMEYDVKRLQLKRMSPSSAKNFAQLRNPKLLVWHLKLAFVSM